MVKTVEGNTPGRELPSELKNLYNIGFALHWLKPHSKAPVKSDWTIAPKASLEELIKDFRPGFNPGVRLGAASIVKNLFLAVIDLDVKSSSIDDLTEALHTLYKLFPAVKNGPHLKSGRGNGSAHYYVLLPSPVSGGEVKARSRKLVKVKIPGVKPSARDAELLTMDELADGMRMRPAWEIQLLSHGRQAVLYGAVHPDTGKRYVWGRRIERASDIPVIEELPAGMNGEPSLPITDDSLQTADKPAKKNYTFADVTVDDFDLPDHHKAAIVSGEGVVDRSHKLHDLCLILIQRGYPDNAIISLLTNRDYYLGQASWKGGNNTRQKAARWLDKYQVQPARAKVEKNSNLFDFDELPEPTKEGKPPAKPAVTGRNPLASENDPDAVKGSLPRQWFGRVPKGILDPVGWESHLTARPPRKNVDPSIEPTLLNLVTIFKNVNPISAILRHDKFSLRDTWNCNTVWGTYSGDQRHGGDHDRLKVKQWLAGRFGIEPNLNLIDEALTVVALENSFHSLQDYLNSLTWDGIPRIENFFRTYYGANMPEPYLSAVSRKFFQACIMRAFEPGCDFDHVVVLAGMQGKGKTKSIQILGGRQWTTSGLPAFKDKDSKVNIQGKWLCEFGELTVLTRSGNEEAKDYITRNTDDFRPPYGRVSMTFPRSTVFIGTTDKVEFLSDTAGNRRFWPVVIKSLQFDKIKRDRDQLWAEAMDNYYFCRENWWLEGEADAQARAIQESKRIHGDEDLLKELFVPWFRRRISNNPNEYSKNMIADSQDRSLFDWDISESTSRLDLIKIALDQKLSMSELFTNGPFSHLKQDAANQRHATNMLRSLGFEQYRTSWARLWKLIEVKDWVLDD